MTERVRKALFDILGERVKGARVLDLFSGTGALGIEALSRGAREVVFVEVAGRMLRLIEENLKRAGLREKAHLLRARLPQGLRLIPPGPYDLIFITPPYGTGLGQATLEALPPEILARDGLIVLEERKKKVFKPEGLPWEWVAERFYGETGLYFLKAPEEKDELRD